MARPKEFDERQVLHKALEVFWRHGYEASSLADLLSAMGLSKSSFYESFGSKHALFLKALTRYQAEQLTQLRARLNDGQPGRESIIGFFHCIIEHVGRPGNGRGCMSCNETVELAPHDPVVREQIDQHLSALEDAFAEAIERGQADGSIGRHHDARQLARFLVVNLNGLQVLTRAKADRSRLEDTLTILESVLS